MTTLACDNSVNFKAPTMPEWPDWQDWPAGVPGTRTLQIEGALAIQDGGVLEATVLYDGLEVPGARSHCPQPAGCAELELEASVRSATGNHTISFLVLQQSRETVDYVAGGTVVVSREGLALGGVAMPLGPTHARLEAGGAVTFEVVFTD